MKKKGIVIPHEHGGWAMVSVPFLLGTIAGNPTWLHIPLFFAWLFLYLSSYPLLQSIRRKTNRKHWIKWGTIYGLIAVACMILPLIWMPSILYFAPPLIMLLIVNMCYAKRKRERALLNDLCAILIFSIGGAAAYLAGEGGWDRTMAAVVMFSFLYFTGSVFFVKSIFRERENKRWVRYAKMYHGILLLVPWLAGYPWMTLSYVYPAARTLVFAGTSMRPGKAGLIEIVGAVLFLLISAYII